jgi:hypothetical protein
VVRDRRPSPVLITDAEVSRDDQLRRREIRYVIMMTIRALCLIAAAIIISTRPPLFGLWAGLCIAGMVLLPWLAVILANDRPARRRGQRSAPGTATAQGPQALPAARDDRVSDADSWRAIADP